MDTRSNNKSLLTKVRTEIGRKTFAFFGARLFNKLPDDIKIENFVLTFRTNCKNVDFDFDF